MSLETVISSNSWAGIIDKISDRERKGYRIKAFEYGNGVYMVAMIENLYDVQSVFHVRTISEAEQKIDQFWKKGYHLTNVVFDGQGFAMVFSYSLFTRLTGQAYFINSDFREFKDSISDYWDKGLSITSIACGYGKYFGVMSKDRFGGGQTMRFHPEGLSKSDIHNLFKAEGEDFIVTGVFSVYHGVIVVYSPLRVIFKRQSVIQSSNLDDIVSDLKEGWEDGLQVEALAYYRSWVMVMTGRG